MKTFEEWIIEANKVFDGQYEYVKIFKKEEKYYFFEINCKKHGIFEKKIQNHIKKKQGCPLCSKPSKMTNEIFICKSNFVHNKKYDYSKINFINTQTKLQIICREHGIFEQLPSNHIAGQGCPVCVNKIKVTNEMFIEKAIKIHGNKYDYTNINYVNSQTNINILCKEHGFFLQNPQNHLKGNQCYKCSDIVRTTEDFIEKANRIHKNLYDYSKTNYISAKKNIIIICKTHGEFFQIPNIHLSGCGCNKCSVSNYSKMCVVWLEYIMKNENIFIQHACNIGEKTVMINSKKYKFDGYCEKTNTVYEFYGDFWHGNPNKYNQNDIHPINKKSFGELYNETINRENMIKENGYTFISIWESETNKSSLL